jgi:integrase/recombinase XerD
MTQKKYFGGGRTIPSESSCTSISTAQACQDYLNAWKYSPRTIEWYWDRFNQFITAFPELPLSPEPIEAFINGLTRRQAARTKNPRTWSNPDISPIYRFTMFRALRSLYYFLERRRRLPIDPQWGVMQPFGKNGIRAPKYDQHKPPASLSETEILQLWKACDNPRDQALIKLLLDSGPRSGELRSLTRENIGDDYIMVKGKVGQRQIWVNPQLCQELKALVKSGPVFRDDQGKPLGKMGIYRVIQRLCHKAGIEKEHVGPHMLRHTFGRQIINRGGDLVTVQKMLGHTTLTMARHYANLADEEIQRKHAAASPLQLLMDIGDNGKKPDLAHEPMSGMMKEGGKK